MAKIIGKYKSLIFYLLLIFVSLLCFAFSYFWVDYGLVLMLAHTHPIINNLHTIINFGNSNRETLAIIYLVLIITLFGLQITLLFSKLLRRLTARCLFITAGISTLFYSFAYPFLSHDIFTYLFSAKMVWQYHVNPFTVVPEEFMATDLWVSFLHNIQFTYAYGSVSLLYSLIPMVIFSGKRFILNFFGLKLMNAIVFYLIGVLLFKLNDKDKKIFSFWFFNPLLVVELLINSHNDLLMISLFIVSMFYLFKGRAVKAWLALGGSIFTKYVSIVALPVMFLNKNNRTLYFKLLSIGLAILLQVQRMRIPQVWYYTWAYMFLPFSKLKVRSWILIDLIGVLLLIRYYPFIKSGFWGGISLIPNSQFLFYLLLLAVMFIELDLWRELGLKRVLNKKT